VKLAFIVEKYYITIGRTSVCIHTGGFFFLGIFSLREKDNYQLFCLGKPIREIIPGRSVRIANESDVESCNTICKAVHGHNRSGELNDSIKHGSAKVVLHGGKITGYTTGLAYFNHSVGLTNDDLKALISSAADEEDSYGGPGILIPTRNTALFRWCLDNGLRLVQQLILMTIGMYNEPAGSYMPSILY
jgi:hypothetical protein